MNDIAKRAEALVAELRAAMGADAVVTDPDEREALSADVYSAGATCAAVVRPAEKREVPGIVTAAARAGFAVIARGGGLTYTGGYTPRREDTVILDLGRLNRIVEIAPDDMYVTAEAGVTWRQLHEALAPLGLRLPCFGSFSGAGATVGGGLSNGALFHGTARYGTVADSLLGLEVVTGDGGLVATGQGALRAGSKPFYRTFGPDLSGPFVHDAGVLGVKVQATFRLVRAPRNLGYASFAFADGASAAAALSEVGRAEVAEEAYVFDPGTTRKNLGGLDAGRALAAFAAVARGQGGILKGIRESLSLAVAGRSFVPEDAYSLHVVCSGRTEAAVEGDVDACRAIAVGKGGLELPNSIPKAVRANPFPPLNDVLGPDGGRWAALNAKVAHSDAPEFIAAAEALLASYASPMAAHGITVSRLMIAISNHAFSFEPVLHWHDEWLPIHRRASQPAHLAKLREPAPDPQARALVHEIRGRLVRLFAERGAASNQIGRTYPYAEVLRPESAAFLRRLKEAADPRGCLNPGALGLG
ncbi:MAG: FAD-binding oxidoreductase [Gammaproteobacteria bacterium]|nr:FAD-binding oxidoreductase [Gammaproteobacteria bacterium]